MDYNLTVTVVLHRIVLGVKMKKKYTCKIVYDSMCSNDVSAKWCICF